MHEGIPLPLIQRQLGHSHLSTTCTHLEGINTEEIISTVHARRAPMTHASAGLALQQALAGAQPRSRTPGPLLSSQTAATPQRCWKPGAGAWSGRRRLSLSDA